MVAIYISTNQGVSRMQGHETTDSEMKAMLEWSMARFACDTSSRSHQQN